MTPRESPMTPLESPLSAGARSGVHPAMTEWQLLPRADRWHRAALLP